MNYVFTINYPIETVFNAVVGTFVSDYKKETGNILNVENSYHNIKYTKCIKTNNNKTIEATVKLNNYEPYNLFEYEYLSYKYHYITRTQLKQIDDKTEVRIFHQSSRDINEPLIDDQNLRRPSLLFNMQFQRMVKDYLKNR